MSAPALLPSSPLRPVDPVELGLASGVWRGTDLGDVPEKCIGTGWNALDAELPGGGWPCAALVECLSADPANFEWRLTSPALQVVASADKPAVAIGPPRQPNMPGLAHAGIDAHALRRSMAAWRRKGGLEQYHAKIVGGMSDRGYEREFAESIFNQIKGFSEYGFPESHAASFALLVYASCWIKCHHPAEFLAAMLNSQPLGFYSPSQLMQDAKRHGVEVRPIDAMESGWDCSLEGTANPPAVRLGFRLIKGMKEASARRLEEARAKAPFTSADDLARRAGLQRDEMTLLAAADALAALSGHRRAQVWEASALRAAPELLREAPIDEEVLELAEAPEGEAILWDYNATGLTLRRHPLALLRPQLWKRGYLSAKQLEPMGDGVRVCTCGIVTLRQQPETAKGVIFVSLEDETGTVQVICWRSIKEAQREELLRSRLLGVHGKWQREGTVRNLIAHRLEDLSPLLGRLGTASRDFQ